MAEVGGRTVYAGSAALLAEHGLAIPDALGRRVDATRAEGATITYLGWGDTAAGFIVLAISGVLNPVVGALVHNAGSVLVIVNSALLLGWKPRVR